MEIINRTGTALPLGFLGKATHSPGRELSSTRWWKWKAWIKAIYSGVKQVRGTNQGDWAPGDQEQWGVIKGRGTRGGSSYKSLQMGPQWKLQWWRVTALVRYQRSTPWLLFFCLVSCWYLLLTKPNLQPNGKGVEVNCPQRLTPCCTECGREGQEIGLTMGDVRQT